MGLLQPFTPRILAIWSIVVAFIFSSAVLSNIRHVHSSDLNRVAQYSVLYLGVLGICMDRNYLNSRDQPSVHRNGDNTLWYLSREDTASQKQYIHDMSRNHSHVFTTWYGVRISLGCFSQLQADTDGEGNGN